MIDDPKDLPDEDEALEIEDDAEGEDAGLDDDEGGDEAEAGQEPEGAEAKEGLNRKPSRATAAVTEAKRIAREASAEAANLKREIEALRRERQQPQGETKEQEDVKLSLMSVEERVDYKLARAEREHARQMGLVQFAAADGADKSSYEAKATYEPRYKKYAAEVEALLQSERQAGRNFPRETILKFVLGQKVMDAKPAVDKQRQEARRRVDKQRTGADASRSDRTASRGRGDGLSDLERRLEGVFI